MKKRAQCGTYSGNAAHYRRGEKPCEECREAAREYQKRRYDKRRAKPVSGTCEICGTDFTGPRGKKYCSKRCQNVKTMRSEAFKRAMARRKANGRPTEERICAHCGNPWTVVKYNKAKHCSVKCGKASSRRCRDLVHVPDAPAFSWLPAAHPVMRRIKPARTWWAVIVYGACGWCEETFTALSTSGNDRYCSPVCCKAAHRGRHGRFNPTPKQRLAIYERDEWTCQLCLEAVDPDLMTVDPMDDWAPSLDHIVPQSKGGTHGADNLRLAHRWCNAVRGDETYYTEADLRAVA